jgi:amidophosphoribosyltransferase
MRHWSGAYSLVVLTQDCVYAVRDPWGFRPLAIGLLPGGGHAVASETGALRTLGCEAIRDVHPGEIVALSASALRVTQALAPARPGARCIFEFVYFARPDQTWEGASVHAVRQRLGEALAREARVEADVVIPVPDSSIPAAIGFSHGSGIPYNDGFVKNRYVGRTFIEPTDSLRRRGVGMKFNVINENVLGRRVLMIDDSIVRGNTTGPLVRLLRNAGAVEVHVAVTCPPVMHPCYMGVDMGTYDNLVAHRRTTDQIRALVEADSLTYLSLDGMLSAVGREQEYCQACFTGNYPLAVDRTSVKTGFEYGPR